MLLSCYTHQPRDTINIYVIKIILRSTANSAGTMDHHINTTYQAIQAFILGQVPLNPYHRSVARLRS